MVLEGKIDKEYTLLVAGLFFLSKLALHTHTPSVFRCVQVIPPNCHFDVPTIVATIQHMEQPGPRVSFSYWRRRTLESKTKLSLNTIKMRKKGRSESCVLFAAYVGCMCVSWCWRAVCEDTSKEIHLLNRTTSHRPDPVNILKQQPGLADNRGRGCYEN